MSELPPYIRDVDQSPPPPPEAVMGQAGRPAVSPPQESALPLSGGGMPPIPSSGPVTFPPPDLGGDRPTQLGNRVIHDDAAPGNYGGGGDPAGFVPAARQGPVTQVVPPGQAVPAGRYTEDNFPIPDEIRRRDAAILAQPTPGPGGTAAVQSPEPAKTQATPPPKQPAPEDKPLATTPGPAALPQPEVSSAPFKGTIPMNGYNFLANKQPEVFNTIADIGQKFGVSTERLIQHARMESDLNLNIPDGKAGERGPFQIEPKTQQYLQDKYLNGRQLDPKTWEGGATLAALKVRECDQRGADSYASVACYNGGGEPSKVYTAEYFSDKKSKDYSKLNFGDLEKPNGGSTMTANGVVKAFRGGPDAGMRYLVDTSSRGSSMSDAWQQAQSALLEHFVGKGDMDGAEKAQNFIMQQAFMGSNIHLMGAMGSLQRGDGMTAAQQLAKAHAFFPDGTAGRFMTNGTDVFGVRLDETTGKPLGQPFKITAQDINSQLKFTGNPMTFAKFLTDQQKAAAEIRLHNAQAGYQELKPALELGKEQGRDTRAAATINQAERNQLYANMRKQAELDAKYSELKGAKDAETAKQVDQWANSDAMQTGWPVPPEYKTPEDQQAYMARRDALARGLKTTAPSANLADRQIQLIADGVIKGIYGILPTMNPKDPSQNGYVVVDPKTRQPVPGSYYINTQAGEAFTNTQHPARALMQQQYQQSQQRQGGVANGPSFSGTTQGSGATGESLARYTGTDPSNNARLGGRSSVAGVGPELTQRIHAMYAAAPPEVQARFEIISGYRDTARQHDVNPSVRYSQHGSGTGPAGTGRAVDLREDPVVLNWVHQNGPKFGVGFPLWNDPKERNHLEMVDPQGRRVH